MSSRVPVWILTLLCAWTAVIGCQRSSHSPSPAAAFAGDGLRVEASLAVAPAQTGANAIELRVRDANGADVDDAKVSVQYSMAMAGQPAMGGSTSADALGGGRYRAPVTLDMSGTWQLALSAVRPSGETARAQGSLRTGDGVIRLSPGDEGMAPVTRGEAETGAVQVDPDRLQKIGVRFSTAERRPLVRSVRALGRVTWDETRLVDVALKFGGFVRDLRANALGVRVTRGEPLFSVYSQDLYAAQAEYLQALARKDPELERAARARLRLWNLADADLREIARRGAPAEALPVHAPASGFVVEKNVVEGASFEAGTRLLRIAPLDRVWIEADVAASDLAAVVAGQRAVISAPDLSGRTLDATVSAVLPSLARETRTGRLRLAVENGDLALRPEMYVDVALQVDLGERLLVPASAVIVSGPRRVVFVDRGAGRLEPHTVRTGQASGDDVEIVEGLEPGTRIVASGNFLIAAESRVQSALEQW
jgi:membrane fusion protein, copper/silver efflux system